MRNASVVPAVAPRTEKLNHVRQPFSNAVPSQSRRVQSAYSLAQSATASTRRLSAVARVAPGTIEKISRIVRLWFSSFGCSLPIL